MIRFFQFIDQAFAKIVEVLLVVIILAMVFLVASQVFFRNVLSSGITWADIISRHIVLWTAFLGAMLATRSREHIAIDAITRLFHRRTRNFIRIGLDVLASAVSLLLGRASYFFVLSEREVGTTLVSDIPTWIIQVIIPFGFAMISLEYAIGVGLDIWRIVKNDDSNYVAGKGRR